MGYLIIPEGTDQAGVSKGSLVTDLDEAMIIVADLAAKGFTPKIFREVEPPRLLRAAPLPPKFTVTDTTPGTPAQPAVTNTKLLAKRAPGDLDRLRTQILSWVVRNPGQGVTAMADGLGVEVKDLTLPIRQLITDKKLTKKGQARASTYYPPRVGPASAAQPKAKRAA